MLYPNKVRPILLELEALSPDSRINNAVDKHQYQFRILIYLQTFVSMSQMINLLNI